MPKDATVRLLFGADTAQAEAALGKLKTQLGNLGSTLTAAGGTLTAAFTAPVAGLIKLASSFDEAMDKIRAGTGATGQALANLGDVFRKVYAEMPLATSIENVSTAISDLATKADLSGKDLENVAKTVLELSRLTGTDLNSTIDASSKLFKNWGVSAGEMVSTLDFLFKVSQSTGVGIDQLNSNIATYGSMLREYGFNIEEAATMIGAFSKQGIELDKVMMSLQYALKTFAKEGVSDAAGALKSVIEQIKNAGSAAEANAIAIQVFGRSGVYMAQQIREGRLEWDALLRSLQGSGETIDKAAKDTQSFADRLDLFKRIAAEALEPLGNRLIDIAEQQLPKLIDAIADITKWWDSLGESGQSAIAKIAMGLAIGGPLLVGLGMLINALKTILGLFGLLVANPIVAAILAIGTAAGIAAASMKELAKSSDEATEAENRAINAAYKIRAARFPAAPTRAVGETPYINPAEQLPSTPAYPSRYIASEDIYKKNLEYFEKYGQSLWEVQKASEGAGGGLGDFTDSLGGAGDAAMEAVEELTPLDKLLQAIAADVAQFKPWTTTEYNLYQLKSMRDNYSTISEQLKVQAEWEKKAAEAAQKRKEALEEMTNLMAATRPEGGLYSSVSEILDSIISKYKTLIQSVQEGKPYVEPQWNVGQQALLEWLQSGNLNALLAQFAKGPSPLYPVGSGQEAMVTRFQDELGKVLESANKKLFGELGLSIDFKTFKTLPSEIQDAVMKIAQLKELQSQAEQAKRASETQMNAANIMLQAARTFASAVGAASARAGGGRPNILAMQSGGLITSPTLALVGEKESEYVIPARRLESLMENLLKKETPITIHIYSEDGKVKSATVQKEAQLFAAYGVRA